MNLTNYAITKKTNPKLKLYDNELRLIMAVIMPTEIRTEGARCHNESDLAFECNGNDYIFYCKSRIESFYKSYGRSTWDGESECHLEGRNIFISNVEVYCDGEEVYLTSEQRRLVEGELEEKVKLSIIN